MDTKGSGLQTGQIYSDIASLNQLRSAARADRNDESNNKAVTQQFESLFVGMMLKSMREANVPFEDKNGMTSSSVKFYEGMLDQQMSIIMSERGGIGLSRLVNKQVNPSSQSKLDSDSALDVPMAVEPRTAIHPGESAPNAIKTTIIERQDIDIPIGAENLPTGWNNSAFAGPSDFITTLWPFAIEASRELGVSPKILVAQAALETGWGRHLPHGESLPSHNLFGIKSGSQWEGHTTSELTKEFKDGRFVDTNSDFRVYEDYRQSFRDYVDFLKTNPRYQTALESPGSDESFIRGIHKAGYATDPRYAEKILSLLRSPAFEYANS